MIDEKFQAELAKLESVSDEELNASLRRLRRPALETLASFLGARSKLRQPRHSGDCLRAAMAVLGLNASARVTDVQKTPQGFRVVVVDAGRIEPAAEEEKCQLTGTFPEPQEAVQEVAVSKRWRSI